MFDSLLSLNPIPEKRSIRDVDDGEWNGHAEYIGSGAGGNDYWNCYCFPERGDKPPETFDAFLTQYKNPEIIKEWWKKYKFDHIICVCDCCMGAIPRAIFGWSKFGPWEGDEGMFEKPDEPEKYTVPSMEHQFAVSSDGKTLIYLSEYEKI